MLLKLEILLTKVEYSNKEMRNLREVLDKEREERRKEREEWKRKMMTLEENDRGMQKLKDEILKWIKKSRRKI